MSEQTPSFQSFGQESDPCLDSDTEILTREATSWLANVHTMNVSHLFIFIHSCSGWLQFT